MLYTIPNLHRSLLHRRPPIPHPSTSSTSETSFAFSRKFSDSVSAIIDFSAIFCVFSFVFPLPAPQESFPKFMKFLRIHREFPRGK
nr:hypothetical protein Iba_chr12fCG14440 [Ipomoea batatas]